MASFGELGVVDGPVAAEVVLVADEALVQWQVGADCVLSNIERKKNGLDLQIGQKNNGSMIKKN